MNEKVRKLYGAIIYIIACALHKEVPDVQYIADVNLSEMYVLAQRHTLTAIVCMGLEACKALDVADGDIAAKWREARDKAIRKNMLMDAERSKIFAKLEQAGIWYMPLKGSVLQGLYPKYGMRQMADNDILIEAECQMLVKDIMVSLGFEAVSVGKRNHDVYEKPPIYNFEMHTSLFSAGYLSEWHEYYKQMKGRLIKDEKNAYGYHFSDEDFYVYMMAHAYKHYDGSGTGLRTLVDTYVYLSVKGDSMNWDYIYGQAQKLGIVDYVKDSNALAQRLFLEPLQTDKLFELLSEKEQEQLAFYAGAGTYGNLKISVEKSFQKIQQGDRAIWVAKCRYLWNRLCPDRDWFQKNKPFVYRHKWMIPFYLCFRLVRGILRSSKSIGVELKIIKKI